MARSALSQYVSGILASVRRPWPVRAVPAALRLRYLDAGWWTDDTLGALVERSLLTTPDSTINIWSRTRQHRGSYADILDDALRLVTALRARGIEPGDVVAFQLPNWWEAVVAFFGLAMGGYVLVPIVHIYSAKEVRFILEQSGARAYVSADHHGHVDYIDIVDGAHDPDGNNLAELALHVVVTDAPATPAARVARVTWTEAVDRAEPAAAITIADADDVCVLAYTSGTTSAPKGVMHTHRTLLAEIPHIAQWIIPGAPRLMGSPVAHATGMLGGVLAPMSLGEDIHLIDRWDPDHVLHVMLEANVGAGTGAAVFLASLLDHPGFTADHARRVGRVGLGGAPVPAALGERAEALGISIVRVYGSTEHPSVAGGTFEDPPAVRHATDGRPLLGVELQLLDDSGAPVTAGEPGEIWTRGPDLCAGYTDPALTETAFDADGWYRTGDMAVLDAGGNLTITDRLSDVIIRGGENISAAEVEAAVTMMPQVAEVAVVAAPDARLGEHACAFVRLAPGAAGIELATITDHLDTVGIARQKWPEELRTVTDFPRTAAGKIRKVDLRDTLRREHASGHTA